MAGKYAAASEKKSKKPLVVIIAVFVALVLAGAGTFFLLNSKGEDTTDISETRVIKDIKASDVLLKQSVGKYNFEFDVEKVDIKSKNKNLTEYTAEADVKNDIYKMDNEVVSVSYTKTGDKYALKSVEIKDTGKLSAVGGLNESIAINEIHKKYKNAKLSSHKTDLEKGKDVFTFTASTKDEKGKVSLTYTFDEKDGWVLDKTDTSKLAIKSGETTTVDVGGVKCYTNSAVKNIMLLGTDADDGPRRSDSMILVSIDSNDKKIKFTSFMRDTYLPIDGNGSDKLNAAFAYGGPKLAVKTIEKNYGIKIDNYITTGFKDFKNIVNALGGVDIKLDQDECGYINWQLGKNGQTAAVGEVEVKDGVQRLNGQQALWFCRDRGSEQFSGDDFTRTSRQRRMMMGLVKSYKSSSVKDIINLTATLKKYVQTDLGAKDLKWLAQNSPKFFDYTTEDRCYPERDKGWSAGTSPVGAWIIEMSDWNATRKDIAHFIYSDLK